MKTIMILLVCGISLGACNTGPQPIEYGKDGCHYCTMTIVDQQHASQVVTSKGKVYKFDAIECMINFLNENEKGPYAHTLVSDFTNPGQLIDAQDASFLISKDIPSPMGAFLSAFNSKEAALKTKNDSQGTVYDWGELLINLKK